MRKLIAILLLLAAIPAFSQSLNKMPSAWKWLSPAEAAFTFDGTYSDAGAFVADLDGNKRFGVPASGQAPKVPTPDDPDAQNPTLSPDGSLVAYTSHGNLHLQAVAGGRVFNLTEDGSDVVYNGYAAWVYYEEIFGRPSKYRAFWWSPDGSILAFYRFDESEVPEFPIYSPNGPKAGMLRVTRYPKAGDPNPKVRVGFVNIAALLRDGRPDVVWADFDENDDQYLGTPFWGPDGRTFYVAREPRIQNSLELFAVNPADGSRKSVYKEHVETWLDWIEGALFTDGGFYMARSFESGWEQIYWLGYDGTLRRLTDGTNWNIKLLHADKAGSVYFVANRGSQVRKTLYKVSKKGVVTALTDLSLNVGKCEISPDGKYYIASLSSLNVPETVVLGTTAPSKKSPAPKVLCDMKGPGFKASDYPRVELISLTVDGLELPGKITYPKGFDPSRQYPVHVSLYGGPNNPMVRDMWRTPGFWERWYYDNGIIAVTVDNRSAGHNGRAGLDQVYKRLNTVELEDYVEWGKYLQGLPYVKPEKIGVDGFSFGGTMTAALLLKHSDVFHYGIAGGGVYDWMLYDSHYTERFMSTPQDNAEGYRNSCVLGYVGNFRGEEGVRLKLTHGTGDDNVHFQNTLLLVDALQAEHRDFDLMVYPDGMHGYRGHQAWHSASSDVLFWTKYLLDK